VRNCRPDIFLWPPLLSEDLPCLGAVLIGKPFIIEVMGKANDPPFLLVLATFPGDVTHHPFYSISMLTQAFRFVISMQKL
jgi:hypothetical protein